MARAPFNVLVFPYRRADDDEFEYALLRRADAGFWQGISGGGEDDETPLETAKRETYEEAGLPSNSSFLQLDTVEPVPVTEFGDSHLWGEDVYVIPQCRNWHSHQQRPAWIHGQLSGKRRKPGENPYETVR